MKKTIKTEAKKTPIIKPTTKKDEPKKTSKREAIANKITDLALKKAPKKQIEKAIKKSMEIIDAEKKAKTTKTASKKVIKPAPCYCRVEFHVTEAALKQINAAAKKAKMSRQEYIRSKVLGK